jgi:cytochrome c oxidase subunit 1
VPSAPEDAPELLDNLALWTAIALMPVALAYLLPLGAIIAAGGLFGPGIEPLPAWLLELPQSPPRLLNVLP